MSRVLPLRFERNVLPAPDAMAGFWREVFPVLSLLGDFVQNEGAYWRRVQRILGNISKNSSFPCPFNQFPQFKDAFNSVCASVLKRDSLEQVILCLEFMPRANDPRVLLWSVGEVLGGSSAVLRILDELVRRNREIWTQLLRSEGANELLLDRLLPYVDHIPRDCKALELRLIGVCLCERVFLDKPPSVDTLGGVLEALLSRIENVLACKNPVELKIECFRMGSRVMEVVKRVGADSLFETYCERLVDASMKVAVLRPLVELFAVTIGYPLAMLYVHVFANSPDHNDIMFVADHFVRAQIAVPVRAIQKLSEMAVDDPILGRTCCLALERLMKQASESQKWMRAFVHKATGFVIIAQSRHECQTEVDLIMDFFVALSRTNVEWLKTLVSDAAATMMASQKVNMAMINILKPSVRFDNTAIQQWLDQKAQNIELRTMLKNVKEEKTPTPPKVTGGTPPPRKAPCVNPRRSMSLPVTVKPPLRKKTPVTYQRQKGGPTIPVVKTNRVFRVV